MDASMTLPLAMGVAATAIRALSPLAERIGLVDKPGGHKTHDRHVPLTGGLGIYAALTLVLLLAMWWDDTPQPLLGALVAGSTLLFVIGVIDDIRHLPVTLRFGAQIAASLTAAAWGGVVLHDLGMLVGPGVGLVELGFWALPLTVFATLGVINALNLVDGIDGLSGSLSVVSLALLAVVAFAAGQAEYLLIILALLGAVGGFLVFNLRCCGRRRAQVFMGDAGSTVLGFLFACLFIGLSQGDGRAMAPVTALWLFAVPLIDTIATMLRRLLKRRSPFAADRTHLHHLLIDAGFTVPQTVLVMVGMQLGLGLVGLAGAFAGVAEHVMFAAAMAVFAVYVVAIGRRSRFVALSGRLHRGLDLPANGVDRIYIGGLPRDRAEVVLREILAEHHDVYGYELYEYQPSDATGARGYAVVTIGCEFTTRHVIRVLRRRAQQVDGVIVRQFLPRRRPHGLRAAEAARGFAMPRQDRRTGHSRLIGSVERAVKVGQGVAGRGPAVST